MIARPHNDRACLDAVTAEVVAKLDEHDPAVLALAEAHADTASLAAWFRSLPQRDDEGRPCDGPKVEACQPPQRLRILPPDPNCLERASGFLLLAERIDPGPVRRLATSDTPSGLHTFPTEDGVPVILDPDQSRNALRAGLFRIGQTRNAAPVVLTPSLAVDWIAELAAEPAARLADGPRRVQNGQRALRAVLDGHPLCVADLGDVALLLALAHREARLWGAPGQRIVRTCLLAIDRLDQAAARRWLDARTPRNRLELRIGRHRIRPNTPLLGALGRVGARLGASVATQALRVKLAAMGITPPVLGAVEHELNREGLSLGPLAAPPPMLGSIAALTPDAIAGRWLARTI